jgi:hypothetical protein
VVLRGILAKYATSDRFAAVTTAGAPYTNSQNTVISATALCCEAGVNQENPFTLRYIPAEDQLPRLADQEILARLYRQKSVRRLSPSEESQNRVQSESQGRPGYFQQDPGEPLHDLLR